LKDGINKMVERIRSLLARFPEDEATVRRLVATDARFNALCQEYREVIELLDRFEAELDRFGAEVEPLRQRRAWLEVELLTRIEGYQPQ
jgi:uncharacterized protein YdcH (DUF465 family)